MERQYQGEPAGGLTPPPITPEAARGIDWPIQPSPAQLLAGAPAAQRAQPVDSATSADAPVTRSGAGAGAATVLIVDDSRTIRHLYSFVLQAAGYVVLAAVDGVEGLEMALRDRPTLLLVDMLMPRMDGLEMLRALRDAEREGGLAQTPALLLTALATPPEIEPRLNVLAVLDKGHLTPSDMASEVRMFLAARAHA